MLVYGIAFNKVQDIVDDFLFAKRVDTDEPGCVDTGLFYRM